MTDCKDFKRIVRERSPRTGETYSSALRNVRNARPDRCGHASKGRDQKESLMDITRAIPEIRSANIYKTIRFYSDLLGFDTRTDNGRVLSFVSATHEGVEVIVNQDGFTLPPGFTIEVATGDQVAELFDRAEVHDVRVIEPLRDAQFSVLDPAGRRVSINAANERRRLPAARDTSRPITRAIPGSVIEPIAAKSFYADYLGFQVQGEWSAPDAVMFESPTGSGAEVLTGVNLTSPDAFDLDVGTTERVDAIHAAAVGNALVMGGPQDFPDHGIRCFLLIDPNGIAMNILAPLNPRSR